MSRPGRGRCVTAGRSPHAEGSRPSLGAVLRHVGVSVLTANVVPGLIFWTCLRLGSIWVALVGALVWCYGAMAWRLATRRRTSALLLIALVGLTAKTALAFASGSTFLYLLQPAVNDAVVAVLFLLSLLTARPVVARLAADFYPVSEDVAARPRIQKLFWRLTAFWALLCLAKSGVTVWLLESMPVVTFVLVKTVVVTSVLVAGVLVTVVAAVRAARAEGLLGPSMAVA